ncbi:hypothetical protein WN55_07568 [Dufourea novaeangliae]|uniref:Uncharacterized protein n=1 Tax=Dufourea novaeangliae TaxID=178035 RepID=A0A154PUJ1_DUFNO|nr:hypothetical protein WN55_07568 [Dufourea novaeangliae]
MDRGRETIDLSLLGQIVKYLASESPPSVDVKPERKCAGRNAGEFTRSSCALVRSSMCNNEPLIIRDSSAPPLACKLRKSSSNAILRPCGSSDREGIGYEDERAK